MNCVVCYCESSLWTDLAGKLIHFLLNQNQSRLMYHAHKGDTFPLRKVPCDVFYRLSVSTQLLLDC